MKHYIAKISSILIAAIIILTTATTAFAEDSLKINGADKTVNKGDTIKFTLNLADTREDVIGFEVRVFYDSEKLELVKGSVTSETFDNLFYNEEIKGKIPLNWTDFNNPVNCANKTPFFSCNFKVLDGGEAKFTYFVTELYGNDMTYLKSYTWSYDVTDGNDAIITDGVLPITDDEETLNNRQSHFINYVDGKGEENSPNKDNHESVVGKQRSTQIQQDVVEVTRYEDVQNGGSGSKSSGVSPMLCIFIGIPVLVVLIIVAIVLANKKNKKAADGSDYDGGEPKFDISAEQQAMEEAGETDDE